MESLSKRYDGWSIGYRMVNGPEREDAETYYALQTCKLRGAALDSFERAVTQGHDAAERGD